MINRKISVSNDSQTAADTIQTERAAIARMSRLSYVHWLAVLSSLLLTTGAWYFTNMQVAKQAEARFERYSGQVTKLVLERMRHYEDALSSAVAMLHASGGDVGHAGWEEYAHALDIETKYPGINGIGIIYKVPRNDLDAFLKEQRKSRPDFLIYPEHDQDVLYPIARIEPSDINAAAIGLDMAHEANRKIGVIRARDSGRPQITGPVVLVQDAQKTPGFLFYMPFYKGNRSASLAERQKNFIGMVYAPFVIEKLIKGVLDQENRLVHFSIRDNDSVLYSEGNGNDAKLFKTQKIEIYGRTWTFDIWDTPEFQAASHSNEPMLILMGGLTIDALLLGLFILLAHSNNRALGFADRMAEKANEKSEYLQRSNEDLERFALVASHDLRTPLRGIGFLADCIRDDLEDFGESIDGTDVLDNLTAMEQQVLRMENLISGILSYSGVTSKSPEPEVYDTAVQVPSICANAGLQPNQYKVTGDLIEFTTDAICLGQVLQNLIENAIKYHPDVDNLQLSVDITDRDDWLEFTVTDNGQGIDPQYHERIFEIFQTLSNDETVGSTGIGLSIVQKFVQNHGGNVRIDSQVGQGSSFSFDWPKHLDMALPRQEAA